MARAFAFNRNIGMLFLGVYLILVGLTGLAGLAIPAVVMAVIALIAGILILIGR